MLQKFYLHVTFSINGVNPMIKPFKLDHYFGCINLGDYLIIIHHQRKWKPHLNKI